MVLTHAGSGFWAWQLVVAMGLNCAVQGLSIAAYAARLAGARSGRVATAISLYNIFATTGRFASMLYMPMLGSLSDRAGALGETAGYQWQLRLIVAAGAFGAVLGTLALPTFVTLYLRAIRSFERFRSIPKAAIRLFRPRTAVSVLHDVKFTVATNIWKLSPRNVPKDVLVLNTLVTAVYGIGIVSAAYASVLNPGAARTALLFSGLVNGIGAVAYNVIVDPTAAFITDQSVKGERSVDDVKALVTYLSFTAILGFMLSQLLLLPAAYVLEAAARLITGK